MTFLVSDTHNASSASFGVICLRLKYLYFEHYIHLTVWSFLMYILMMVCFHWILSKEFSYEVSMFFLFKYISDVVQLVRIKTAFQGCRKKDIFHSYLSVIFLLKENNHIHHMTTSEMYGARYVSHVSDIKCNRRNL